ncbi:MAG: hypothetical protein IT379_36265 [Deltaproteobacteria bacterium]|nr:hypothetical protein [Deltaproteobacteria bacterium]
MAWARAVVVAACLSLAGVAHAQQSATAAADVGAVRELVAGARYDEAVAGATALLLRTDLTAAERNVSLELLATAYIAQRDERRARETLTVLYARDPGHALSDPDASPVVRAAFEAVRASPPAQVAVGLTHTPPGRDDVLVVTIGDGADAIHELRLAYRHPGEPDWARVVMSRRSANAGRSRLPRDAGDGRVVEWFVEGVAPSGRVLASLGSEAEPMRVTLIAQTRRVDVVASPTEPRRGRSRSGGSVLETWWFWTLVGVVVVGGGVAVGVAAAGPSTDPAPTGSLGQRRLQ